MTWARTHLYRDATFDVNTPPPGPNVSEQPRPPGPAVVPQTSNPGSSTSTTTPPPAVVPQQYHFHTYYVQERAPELVEVTDEEDQDEDEDDNPCDTILPMRIEDDRYPPHPFQR